MRVVSLIICFTQLLRKDGDEFVLQIPIPSDSKIPSYDAYDTGSWVRRVSAYIFVHH